MRKVTDKNTRIVYHCPETDKCKIVIPALEAIKKHGLDHIVERSVPKGVPYRVVSADHLPDSRKYRDAWTDKKDTDTVDVDMAKARELQMNFNRQWRDKELEKLDKDTMIALGKDDKKALAEVEAKKQSLRDMPEKLKKDMEACSVPEDLVNVIPQEYKDKYHK